MTIIKWIVWEEKDRVVGIDFNHEVDVDTCVENVRIGDHDVVTRVRTREEWDAEMRFHAERAEEDFEAFVGDDEGFESFMDEWNAQFR